MDERDQLLWLRVKTVATTLLAASFAQVKQWPERWVRVQRDGKLAFVGFIAETKPEGATLRITAHAPEKLIVDARESPFPPPMGEFVTSQEVFEFWWKQIDYVFGLPDPRTVPPLSVALPAPDRGTVERYIAIAADLAGSGLLNALEEGFFVNIPDGPGGAEEIEKRFSRRDLQVGFAALLRQCDSSNEGAHFERVRSILWVAAEQAQDQWREARLVTLSRWSQAAKALHAKSLNQLLRDRLVSEGVGAVAYDEEHSPEQLLSIYNYGDLIHWSARRDTVADWSADEYVESDRRLAYLDSAAGLAHVYVGFGELARRAIGWPAVALA